MLDQPCELTAVLMRLWRDAGEPSSRSVGKAIGYSHTVVAQALRPGKCPSWPVVEKLVIYFGGDLREVKSLWSATRDAEQPLPGLASGHPPVASAGATDDDSSADVPGPVVARWKTTDGVRSDTLDIFDAELAVRLFRELRGDGDDSAAI